MLQVPIRTGAHGELASTKAVILVRTPLLTLEIADCLLRLEARRAELVSGRCR